MPIHGIGSISSPIVISDDEDEENVIQLLRSESPAVDSNDGQRVFAATIETRDGHVRNDIRTAKEYGASNTDHQQRVLELADRVEPVPAILKRKRDEAFVASDPPGSGIANGLGDGYPRPESKKARKRRRRLERMEAQLVMEREQMMGAESRYMLQTPQRAPHLLAHMPTLQPWPGAWPTFNPHLAHTQGSVRRPTDHFTVMTQGVYPHQSAIQRNTPSVSSMPHSSQAPSFLGGLPSKPADLDMTLKPQSLMYPVVPMGQSRFPQQMASPVQVQPPVPKTRPRPGPPKKSTSIGVPHDNSTHGSHGFFTSCKIQPNGEPFAPNPSRTLVMEQLPKNHRKRDVVRSWCKSVCGIFPVHAEVNSKGRALVEFPSAEMARRAFMSPQDVFGKSSVKVWWYRGTGPKKPEIEEGEIDEGVNQGSEKPVTVSNAKKKKAQQSAKKWEQKQKNLNQEADAPTGLATQSVVSTSSGGGLTQHNVQSLSSAPLMHSGIPTAQKSAHTSAHALAAGPIPMIRPSLAEHVSPVDCRESFDDPHFDDSGYAAERDDNDDASIASSRAGSVNVEPVTPNAKGDNDYFSEDMDVESPVTNRQSFDVFNDYQRLANRHQQHLSPPQDPGISAQHDVASSTSTSVFKAILQPQSSKLDSTSQESCDSLIGDSSNSVVPSAPSNIASELRAVKNTPTGPTFAKRSLLARNKNLEERLKMELTKAVDHDHALASSEAATASTPASSGTVTPVAPASVDVMDKATIEDNLRRLVLESKRNKGHSSSVTSLSLMSDSVSYSPSNPIDSSTTPTSIGSATSTSSVSSTTSTAVMPTTPNAMEPTAPNQDALDDLAVSFITEAIQTIKSPPPVPPKPSHLMIKLELAAKQQSLEKQIAESKILMAQLSSARTKQEKDRILALMRERSRAAEDDARPTPMVAAGNQNFDFQTAKDHRGQCKLRWPETREDAGVLMISDDEDDM